MTAFRGDELVTVLREQRTRLVPAGSAPVYPTRAEALLSSHLQYGEAILAEGRWSQLYTASLHNWNEFSRIRFDRDLRWSYLVFGPLANGDMPSYPPTMPQQIDLAGVNNSGGRQRHPRAHDRDASRQAPLPPRPTTSRSIGRASTRLSSRAS